MDPRTFIAAAVGLVLLALGGFYFALSPRSHNANQPVRTATAPGQPAQGGATQPVGAQAPAAQTPTSQASTSQASQAPAQPAKVTTATIEDELAHSEHAPLQALLKKYFPDEYNGLIAAAVGQRNAGVSGAAFDQDLVARIQDMMRTKLKFATGASTAMIDQLAANEVNLFHALGTGGAAFCLKVLGKDTTPSNEPAPDDIQRIMRLGMLYRFQAIVEGSPNFKPIEPLTADEMGAFQASLATDGMKFEDVRSGAFLTLGGNEPGKPCLMVEKLYRSIARLPESARRKIYAGVFFLGRDK
jgi:hypothetical protein